MRHFRILLLATSALTSYGLTAADANPLGAQVVGGSVTVQGQGTPNVIVKQQSNSAIVNWNTFNIGAGEKTSIVMPSSSSVQLDRVTGGLGPSQILGSLWSNGHVFLVNPDGMLFGAGATINTAGFLATTHDISNADFMAGKYNFSLPGNPTASVVNLGTITASNAGFAALVAPGVRNSGTITANLGTVALASGNGFTLDFYGDKLITLNVNDSIAAAVRDVATGQTLNALVRNDGKLKANGGRVELTAVAARRVVDSVINNTGVIEANSVGTRNGMIVLGAATAGTLPAGAPPQTVRVSGRLSAAGRKHGATGGTIQVTGQNIVLAGATIGASGRNGGGTVLIGGGTGMPTASNVAVDAATTINASATDTGDGGKVVVWADQATTFLGTILARGGATSGNGGSVETSGHLLDFAGGRVDTSARNGRSGSWLLDPYDLTIDAPAAATISSNLATTNVTIETTASGASGPGIQNSAGNGDIFISSSILWGSANSLSFSAYRNIEVNASITNTAGAAAVNLRADNTGIGAGTVTFRAGIVSTAGATSIYYDPVNYSSPANYSGNVFGGGTLAAYMLVNSVGDLQNIAFNGTTLGGTYALGKNIDATGFVSAGPGTTLTGTLDGNGGLGTNYTISNLTLSSNQSPVGLFGFIGTNGTVRNLNMANVNLAATGNLLFMGPLAGENDGTISNVQVLSGAINGGAHNSIGAGGLVGQNRGTISNSSAAVNVTLGDAPSGSSFNDAGGLVGTNLGTITSSSASGAAAVGLNGAAGGLVGQNALTGGGGGAGTITSSFATGAVTGTGNNSIIGGLVGSTASTSTITGSHASGNVTLTSPGTGSAGGLVGQNLGQINLSFYDTGTISGSGIANADPSQSQFAQVGGLVGQNFNNATIQDSHATATIGGSVGNYGGLAGYNFGTITGTAPGLVFANSSLTVGGAHVSAGALVGANGNAATIHNANATGSVTVIDATVLSKIGGLAGQNDGSIDHSTANVTVTGGFGSAGGLVGQNDSVISFSSASGNVVGAGSSNGSASLGGLAGNNNPGGQISNSSASGSVTAGAFSDAGGLVGDNQGTISNSSATGNASSTAISVALGGLAGANSGTIQNTTATGNVTLGDGVACSFCNSNFAGGLVGNNFGTISGSSASGPIVVGANSEAGGLVGLNQPNINPNPSIDSSFATGNVSSAGVNVTLGGLVGSNTAGARITSSYATGNVTATAAITGNSEPDCTSNCQHASAGGLAGLNSGTIQGASTVPTSTQACVAGQTCATGAVSVGSRGVGGGLVGYSDGLILNAFATGAVTGAAGNGSVTNVGGLVGTNLGLVSGSHALGDVGALNVVYLSAGGLVSDNSGTITNSFSTGNVRTGDNGLAGGLTSTNSIFSFSCLGCAPSDGSAYLGTAAISGSHATGNVTVGSASLAGGLSASVEGANTNNTITDATITNSSASGAVSAAGNSILGGLVGISGVYSTITNSNTATTSTVSGTGTNSWVGGFIGANGGTISSSSVSGPVNSPGLSNSLVGGFAGLNLGSIVDSTTAATSSVTATGANNYVGGFVGLNFGLIDPSTSAGAVTGGPNNVVGGFAGSNATFYNVPSGLVPGSTFPVGVISADSVASGPVMSGANSTTGTQVGTTAPAALPAVPSVTAGCGDDPLCAILLSYWASALPPPSTQTTTSSSEQTPLPPPITQVNPPITNAVTNPILLANLTLPSAPVGTPPPVGGPSLTPIPGRPGFIPPPLPGRSVPGPDGETRSSVPPLGETRFIQNQVLLQLGLNIPDAELTAIVQQLGLRIITSDTLTTLGRRVIRLELPAGMSVRAAIVRLEANRLVSVAAPIYNFRLMQPAASATMSKGDAAQYMLGRLRMEEAHAIASGKGITIALIDSAIDKQHAELQGAIIEEFDAVGGTDSQPLSHGTEMAGAIVSRARLLGVAPGAKILAVRAFSPSNNTSEGTSLSIVKGLDWAVSRGARVINMSFAGPRDPSLERALKAAHDKGVVLIGAAGNAGPKSPPLYPGADPNVMAVTATDSHDQRLRAANQGPQLSVAAPGVEILAPAPQGSYDMSTGTSIATAHVSGVVALMLERDPTLKPNDVRRILEATATDLGTAGKDNLFGWGLVNPPKALEAVAAQLKSSNAAPNRR